MAYSCASSRKGVNLLAFMYYCALSVVPFISLTNVSLYEAVLRELAPMNFSAGVRLLRTKYAMDLACLYGNSNTSSACDYSFLPV
jgi:hypothetical protein